MLKSACNTIFSIEFFPPCDTAGRERLVGTAQQLTEMQPSYISVTYGAGGSTQQGTTDTIQMLLNMGCDAVPHLSCVGSDAGAIEEILDSYKAKGIKQVVALRGDLPSGMGLSESSLRYASDLVSLIRQHSGDWFGIKVAAYPEMHPQSDSPDQDLENFIHKVQAGANSAITQYFYNADAYFDFVNRLQSKGISIPIVAGIMPITNYSQLMRFSQMCGAEIPRWIRLRLQSFGDDKASIRAFGHDVVVQLCARLLEQGVPGIHFYTLNQAEPTLKIWRDLV